MFTFSLHIFKIYSKFKIQWRFFSIMFVPVKSLFKKKLRLLRISQIKYKNLKSIVYQSQYSLFWMSSLQTCISNEIFFLNGDHNSNNIAIFLKLCIIKKNLRDFITSYFAKNYIPI